MVAAMSKSKSGSCEFSSMLGSYSTCAVLELDTTVTVRTLKPPRGLQNQPFALAPPPPSPCKVLHPPAIELTLRIVRKMVASCSTGMVRMRCRKPTGTPEAGWVGYMAKPLARAATAPACTHLFHLPDSRIYITCPFIHAFVLLIQSHVFCSVRYV